MILLFFPLFLFALNLDFSSCYKKYEFINDLIPVTKNKSVTFKKPKNYLYFDPFTNLYVVKTNNKRVIKFYNRASLGWWMAGIKKNSVYGGTYASEGYFLDFSKLSVDIPKNSVVSDLFCRAYGVGNKGFLDTNRLLHFVKYGYWGDIGIGVDNNLKVIYSDPFYTLIKPGEKVLYINSKKATPKIFTNLILLGKVGKKIKIVTNKREYLLKIRKLKYNFTPLEYYGIKVDKNLTAYLKEDLANRYFLKEGKIVKVNNKKVNSFKELLYLLSFDKNVTITLKKDGIRVKVILKDKNGRVYKEQFNKSQIFSPAF